MSGSRRRRLRRVRVISANNEYGWPVRVVVPTLWGRVARLWDWWRRPR